MSWCSLCDNPFEKMDEKNVCLVCRENIIDLDAYIASEDYIDDDYDYDYDDDDDAYNHGDDG